MTPQAEGSRDRRTTLAGAVEALLGLDAGTAPDGAKVHLANGSPGAG